MDRSLEALRALILENDIRTLKKLEQQLQEIRHQISNKEELINSLEPVIADLLERKIYTSKDEMAEASHMNPFPLDTGATPNIGI